MFRIPADKGLLQEIKKNLNEDLDILQERTRIFKEWLKCEPHLPEDVDENLIQSFLRSNDYDLDKSKGKFEQLLSLRIQMDTYYQWNFDEKYFKTQLIHKQYTLLPKLTSKGDRVLLYRFPKNVEDFVCTEFISYLLFLADYLIYEDTYRYLIGVCDLKEISAEHIAKMNMADVLKMVDIVANLSPLRVSEAHFFPFPAVAETFVNLVIGVLNKSNQKTVQIHQDGDMLKFIPKDLAPKDYGGTGMYIDEHADIAKRYFLENRDWIKKTRNFKLTGPVPTNKKNLYLFKEEVQTPIQKLVID